MKHPHDYGYKYLFSNKRIFYQLITSFVHEDFVREIDIEHMEVLDKSFISDEFLSRESDLIYRVQFKESEIYIYILMEFQSTVDKSIPVRMLLYELEFYDLLLRNRQGGKLPSVFPLLLYNGQANWTIPVNIADLIDKRIPARYIPSFEYFIIIEKDIPDEVLLKLNNLIAAVIFLEKRKDEEGLRNAIDRIITMIRKENLIDIKMFTIWLNHIFRQDVNAEVEKIKDITEVKHMLSSIADQIMKKGEKKGEKKGITGVARNMKQKGYDVKTISDATGLSEDEIEKL